MAELDAKRLEVCLLNHPGAEGIVGDLRETWPLVVKKYRTRAGRARPSLLCACPPCQGMSSARAGKGSHDDAAAGSKDDRNLLVTVVAKVALALKPALLVVENVPAFLSRKVHHPDDGLPVSAANLLVSSLSGEYVTFPLLTDLCDFGIPQSRNRAFLTFIRKDVPGLKEILRTGRAPFPRATHAPELSLPPVTLDEALRTFGLPTLDAATPERASARHLDKFHFVPVWDERTYSMVNAIPKGSGLSAWDNNCCSTCGPVDVDANAVICPSCGAPLLRPVIKDDQGHWRLIRGFKSSYRRMHGNRPAATVTTASGHIGSDYTIHPSQNRLLSLRECALLQTFPSDFQWGNALEKLGHTRVREMIGEAVPPAFTLLHGEVLRGILDRRWQRAPIALSDERCTDAWLKLSRAAKKDGRENPRDFFDYENKIFGQRRKRVFDDERDAAE